MSVDHSSEVTRVPAQLTALLYALRIRRTKKISYIAHPAVSARQLTAAGRAVRAGLSQAQCERVVEQVAQLDPSWREAVLHPLRPSDDGTLRWCGFQVRQPDQLSCVPTVLAVQAAHGNIALSLWLISGFDVGGIEPKLLKKMRASDIGQSSDDQRRDHSEQIAARFDALVRYFHVRATHRGPFRVWPRRWGTPPWGAARLAHHGRYRFTPRLVNDLDLDNVKRVVGTAIVAADRGVPSLLYVGGDSSTSYRDATPRHAVLLHRSADGSLAIFEPAAGRVFPVAPEDLARSGGPRQEYGGWTHIGWAVVPVQPDDVC